MSAPLDEPRPRKQTSPDELCKCTGKTPLKLMQALGANPIHCLDCNLEVPPECLDLDTDLIEAMASWRDEYDAMDRLWLDSGTYEEWAVRHLTDINSVVNKNGRGVQRRLNALRRCYYWYFQDQSAVDFEPSRVCPACGGPLQDYSHGIFKQRLCDPCSIVLVAE